MTQRRYQVIIILPIKSKLAAARKQCFLRFLYFTESSPLSFKVWGLQMTMNFSLVQVHISSRHSNLNFAHHFVIYWLFQNGANKNQHQDSYQRETVPDKFVFFSKLVIKAKKVNRVSKMCVCMCVFEICAEGIFVTSPWWLEDVKSRSKITLFFKWAPFWNLISKKENNYVFSEVDYLNYTKKTQFCMWQLHFP